MIGSRAGRPHLRAVVFAAVLAAGPAAAQQGSGPPAAAPQALAPVDLSGRWHAPRSGMTVDVTRCASGWCGVAVEPQGCGGRVMTLSDINNARGRLSVQGSVQVTEPEPRRYVVHGWTTARGLEIVGEEGGAARAMRQVMPFSARFERQGEPQCSEATGAIDRAAPPAAAPPPPPATQAAPAR